MSTEPDSALLKLVSDYEDAFNANRAEAMNELFVQDPVFVNFGGGLVRGREPLYRAQAFVFGPGGPLEDVRVDYTVENVTRLAPGLVAIHARQRSAGRAADGTDEAEDPMEALFLIIAELVDGTWRIRLGQNTPVR